MGGMETHLQSLCGGLQDLVDLKVIVANDARHSATDVVDGINVMRLGRSFNFAAAPICPDMSRRIREAEADIIHIHVPNPTAILAYLASRHRGRLVVTYHSDIIRQKVMGRAFRPVLERALRRSLGDNRYIAELHNQLFNTHDFQGAMPCHPTRDHRRAVSEPRPPGDRPPARAVRLANGN